MDNLGQKTVMCPLCSKLILKHSFRVTDDEGRAVHVICYEELILEVVPNRQAGPKPSL
jgi:hypothetical protein